MASDHRAPRQCLCPKRHQARSRDGPYHTEENRRSRPQFAREHTRRRGRDRDFACAVREQTSLNFASHLEILLEAELRIACFLIEARIFERNGDIGAKGRKHAFVFQGERARFRAFQIKNSDQSIAQ